MTFNETCGWLQYVLNLSHAVITSTSVTGLQSALYNVINGLVPGAVLPSSAGVLTPVLHRYRAAATQLNAAAQPAATLPAFRATVAASPVLNAAMHTVTRSTRTLSSWRTAHC